jgi:hypothetical protein
MAGTPYDTLLLLQVQVSRTITLPPISQTHLDVGFRPLLVGTTKSQLNLKSLDLGTYTYDLVLNGLPPPPIAPLSFMASLGTAQSQVPFTP